MTSPLSVSSLSVSRGSTPILHDINFTLVRGEFTALVGPNGAGKTTLIEAVSAVRPAQSGQVLLAGEDINHLSHIDRSRKLALIGREVRSHQSLRVHEVVSLGRFPHRQGWGLSPQDKASINLALKKFDCEIFRNKSLAHLSDGERQRVQWARAHCQETQLLLLDEATSHLDIAHRERSFNIAREFTQEGGTILAVAHELDLAARHACRILVLNKGKIVADGPPSKTLTPQLLSDVFGVRAELKQLPEGPTLVIYGLNS